MARKTLAGHVRFLGVLTGPAKWQTFLDADIFCFPAFLTRKPSAFVAVGSDEFRSARRRYCLGHRLADIVTNEVGIVVPTRDPVAISAALSALIHDPDRRVKLGEAEDVGILNYSRWNSSS